MEFTDPKKEYEIVFDHMRKASGHHTPVFSISLTNPVKATDTFEKSAIREVRGVCGIYFEKTDSIPKALKAKQSALLGISPEAEQYIKETADVELQKLKEQAQQDPQTWKYTHGCDTGRLYLFPNTETGIEFRPDLAEIAETVEKEHLFDFENFPGDNGKVPHALILKLFAEIQQHKQQAKEEREKKRAEIFEKARKTGQKQIIKSYTVDCCDPREDCDVDIVTVYAMPDGTESKTQVHTY
jgi:hypothetical protein